MNGIVKTVVALTVLATLVFRTHAEVGPCEQDGIFACEDPTEAGDNCDYYTCVYYPSLNKWLLTKYKCSEGATWDDEAKQCIVPTTTSSPEPSTEPYRA